MRIEEINSTMTYGESEAWCAVMTDRENRDAVAILVKAPPAAVKTVRVNITLPEDVLAEIHAYSERHGLRRSGFLAKAAKDVMKLQDA
jgi:hypothetical protein